jgi:hypothetical protein
MTDLERRFASNSMEGNGHDELFAVLEISVCPI